MENTLNSFKHQQSKTLDLLHKLAEFLSLGKESGVSIDPTLTDKLQNAIDNITSDKLKVALIGGFSEGKTSIAAAWMEKLDKSSMNISHQESSNEVKVYEVGDDFVLIDTPGLFGFKEQENLETHAIEKYKDITKRHVSDAHLVLYVMNPTNPIKESHKDDLIWLFRKLNLLSRTVFVLSRFDEVADVEDEEDYEENLQIKRENITGRLSELIGLSDNEAAELTVVAVAANPFDMGVSHWLENTDQFKELSHISTLQAATTQKIQKSGGNDSLIIEMRTSVIRDVLHKQLPVAIETDEIISQEVTKLEKLHNRLADQLAHTNQQIEETRISLRDFVTEYFSDLILQAKGCGLDTFTEFFEREIGSEGIILNKNLQNEFSRQMGSISLEVQKMQIGFDNEVSHFNTTVKALGKNGINHAVSSNMINNKSILIARDGVSTVAKTFGVDLAKYLKFKPWGAVKMAKGVNGALAFVGVAIEAWDSYEQHKREKAFQEAIKKMVENFEIQRRELLVLINSEEFKSKFFEDYIVMKERLVELKANLDQNRERQMRFVAWRKEAEAINEELCQLH
ncbi:Labile enterotoxin output A [Halomonas sp. NYA30]|tara:strand:+ start:240 stop:1943 length:1704 start_codon:yes stop_codon:yes gene_type:complete